RAAPSDEVGRKARLFHERTTTHVYTLDVARASALCDQTAARLQRNMQASKQRVVIQYPMKRRGAEDRVRAVAQRERGRVAQDECDPSPESALEILPRRPQHIRR